MTEENPSNPGSVETHRVDVTLPGVRLDQYLRSVFPGVSRGSLQRFMADGNLLLNGKPTKPSHGPKAGDVIELTWPRIKPSDVLAENIPLEVLFEDRDVLVLNKQPGLVVHPAAGHEEHTLVNALLHHCDGQLSGIGGIARPGIVHRLDMDTSGCMVVAKNDNAHVALSEQFANRDVTKVYAAILCGVVMHAEGEIDASIARHPNHRKRMAVQTGRGREAQTGFRVIRRLQGATLVDAFPQTGRTHQIRVHFQFMGHPLVGDGTYGSRQNSRLFELTGYRAPRQMLHARELAFEHPRTGTTMVFAAPFPDDFKLAITTLERPAPRA